ncbi:MAG TPA: hypothetical protein VGK94_09890 [Candidatus Polarisedimenticolia bacterium]|jgi:plastocyanin
MKRGDTQHLSGHSRPCLVARSRVSLPAPDRARSGALLLGSAIAAAFLSLTWGAAAPAAPEPQAAEATATGSLRGNVRVGPRLAGRRVRFNLYPDVSRASAAPGTRSPNDELANVVVYFESAPELAAVRTLGAGPCRIEQSGEAFLPHVLPVAIGTTVEFPNADAIYHNVFSLSRASSFDLGRYPKGSSRSVRFDQPGIVKVFCHIHSDMSAVVLVLDHSFFTIPDANGAYAIDGIPPGRYVITGWHERARPIHREVLIEAGRQAEMDLAIPLEEGTDDR